MQLHWVEAGSYALPPDYVAQDDRIPLFFCLSCRDWDNEPLDPKHYAWIVWGNFNRQELNKAKTDMTPEDYQELLADLKQLKNDFMQRPYLAIPQ